MALSKSKSYFTSIQLLGYAMRRKIEYSLIYVAHDALTFKICSIFIIKLEFIPLPSELVTIWPNSSQCKIIAFLDCRAVINEKGLLFLNIKI